MRAVRPVAVHRSVALGTQQLGLVVGDLTAGVVGKRVTIGQVVTVEAPGVHPVLESDVAVLGEAAIRFRGGREQVVALAAPVGEARQIIEAVKANGGIVDSLIFPDEGHGSSKRVNVIKEYRKQVEFFDRTLKGIQVRKEEG